jgi:hypothetical protein
MTILHELIEIIQKNNPNAAIMPFSTGSDDTLLTSTTILPASDNDGNFVKTYMMGLRTQEQWLHTRLIIRTTTTYHELRKKQSSGLLTWSENYDEKIDLDIATSKRTVRTGFFVLADASHRSVPTFMKLIDSQCPELLKSGIPRIYRIGYRTTG